MKPSNVDELIREKEELWDLLEDLTGRICEIREKMCEFMLRYATDKRK